MNHEHVQKYAHWVVFAVLSIIALYVSTQVLLLSSLPTDPRRAPDVILAQTKRTQFIAVGHMGPKIEERLALADSMAKTCHERGCDLYLLLGNHLPPHGMKSNRDPRMDEWVRDAFSGFDGPIYMALGPNDYGEHFDRLTGIREVRWATRTSGFEMPSSTYFFKSGPASFWAFDTNEEMHNQAAWLTKSISTAEQSWRIGFAYRGYNSSKTETEKDHRMPLSSFYQNHICGAFDLFFSADEEGLYGSETCGTDWVNSSGHHPASPSHIPREGAIFDVSPPGYTWVEVEDRQITLAFYDGHGTLQFEWVLNKNGITEKE